jgi:hypothetical protein
LRTPQLETAALLLAFALVVLYSVGALFFGTPYSGLRYDPRNGKVDAIYDAARAEPTLHARRSTGAGRAGHLAGLRGRSAPDIFRRRSAGRTRR